GNNPGSKIRQTPKEKRALWLAQAMFLVRDHPEWSDARIANQVGVNRSQLNRDRCPEYQAAAAMARGKKKDVPSGYVNVDPDTGVRSIEASSSDGDPAEMDWDD